MIFRALIDLSLVCIGTVCCALVSPYAYCSSVGYSEMFRDVIDHYIVYHFQLIILGCLILYFHDGGSMKKCKK